MSFADEVRLNRRGDRGKGPAKNVPARNRPAAMLGRNHFSRNAERADAGFEVRPPVLVLAIRTGTRQVPPG